MLPPFGARHFVPTIFKIPGFACVLMGGYGSNTFFLSEFVAMKHPITIRLDPELLANARIRAKEENRTLTNFLETALKERFEASGGARKSKQPFDGRKTGRSAISKKVSNAK